MRNEQQTLDRAISLHNKGDIAAAAKLYRRIIHTSPHNLEAVHLLGVAEAASGNIDLAKSLMDRSLNSTPVNLQFLENYAAVMHRAGEHEAAIELSRRGLQLAPTSAVLLQACAAALSARDRHKEAIEQLARLLSHHPNHFPAHFMLGSAYAKTRQHDAALACYERALRLNPQLAEAHLDQGTIHFTERRHHDALAAYDKALSVRPDYAEAWLGRGYTLIQLGDYGDALTAMEEALTHRPELAEAWVGRGNALLDLDRPQDAATAFDRALTMRPEFAAALTGHGNVHARTGRHGQAEAAFDRALAADAGFAEAWLGRGVLQLSLGRHDDALAALDQAVALNPGLPMAWLARGQIHYLEKRFDAALADWNRTLALNPDQPGAAAACLRVRMHHCDWSGFDEACARVRSSVRNGGLVAPFMFVAIPSSPAEQLQCARRWIDRHFRSVPAPGEADKRPDRDRLHVAYLSADFHEHATSHLMAGIFEQHDKARYQITAISIGPDDGSSMRRRMEAAFDRFVDARSLGDDEIAELIRVNEVDILIDLKGYTQGARTGILAMRPAPIQVNYLGFPGTIGADFIDYVIADPNLIPEQEFDCYSEKVVWLPETYQANDHRREIAGTAPNRAAHGLPGNAFVFCCFNDNYKITPEVFSGWMRILHAVESGVLWLFEDNAIASENLRREAAARGIAPERLIFARRMPNADHLARHRCADLFLDTLPYGAHTTASDALWAGLPVLTCRGQTFAGRVGASLLNAVRIPELITTSAAAYEALAIRLAHDRVELSALKCKLDRNRLTTPLFDTRGFTVGLETAYAAMMQRYRASQPPEHIRVDSRQV